MAFSASAIDAAATVAALQGRWLSDGPGNPVHVVQGTSVQCETTRGVADLEVTPEGICLVGVPLIDYTGGAGSVIRWADGDTWRRPLDPVGSWRPSPSSTPSALLPADPALPRAPGWDGSSRGLDNSPRGSLAAPCLSLPSGSPPDRFRARRCSPEPLARPPSPAASSFLPVSAHRGPHESHVPQNWPAARPLQPDRVSSATSSRICAPGVALRAGGAESSPLQPYGGDSLLADERQKEAQRDSLSIDEHRERLRAETAAFLYTGVREPPPMDGLAAGDVVYVAAAEYPAYGAGLR
eukprot:TRINITY_DN31091_c0_g1_i1.p1 TRINITY_DN31091_c0_g1~~TRINITY_DN31091_c0_g1_i1.p1  ORF type:complete len:313 (+),score=77.43 TRINITY_DN31091_c0_g1_i1:53-940(+)